MRESQIDIVLFPALFTLFLCFAFLLWAVMPGAFGRVLYWTLGGASISIIGTSWYLLEKYWKYQVQENTVFAITTRRVLIIECGYIPTVQYLAFERIESFYRVCKKNGGMDVVFSEHSGGIPLPTLTFNDIPDADKVQNIMESIFRT